MDFAARLAELRKSLHLTQKALAEASGISLSAIGKYEARIIEPSVYSVITLAKFFEVSVDYLLGLED